MQIVKLTKKFCNSQSFRWKEVWDNTSYESCIIMLYKLTNKAWHEWLNNCLYVVIQGDSLERGPEYSVITLVRTKKSE